MAKKLFLGISGVARTIKQPQRGVSGIARNEKSEYIGVSGVARQCYESVLPSGIKDLWSGTEFLYIKCIKYANGYWVAGGNYSDGNKRYARIAYATSLNGPWTIKDLWSHSTSISLITDIDYANGYWVVGGVNQGNYGNIAYATSPDDVWTIKTLWRTNGTGEGLYTVKYINGYWVLGSMYYDGTYFYGRIAYTTNPEGTWTTKDLWSYKDKGCGIKCIEYANGYWVVGGFYQNYYGEIAYATSLDGTWTRKTLRTGGSKYTCHVESIVYANGYWAATVHRRTSSKEYLYVYYCTTPDAAWTEVELENGTISYISGIGSIVYADGYWAIAAEYGFDYNTLVLYSTDLTGTWAQKTYWSDQGSGNVGYLTYEGGYWVLCKTYYDGTNHHARITYATEFDDLGNAA